MPPLGRPSTPTAHAPGVNLAGYFDSPLSLGQVARRIREALEAAGAPVHAVTLPDARRPGAAPAPPGPPRHGATVICANAEGMEGARAWLGAPYLGQPTAAVWWWELEEFPARWRRAFDGLDEVWAFSSFVAEAIRPQSPVPVRALPLPLPEAAAVTAGRAALGLPEGTLFLSIVDLASGLARKNPIGAIEAFTRAFAADDHDVALVIKHVGGDDRPAALAELEAVASRHDGVHLIGGEWQAADIDALMASCDCYVSLHRSEGFGLPLAQATLAGKPVVATGYSGPLEFLDAQSAHLVGWTRVGVGPGNEPYPAEAEWAEPDIDEAARLLRAVRDDPEAAATRADPARERLLTAHAPARAGRVLAERAAALATGPRNVASSPEVDALERLIRISAPKPGPGRSRVRAGLRGAILRVLRPVTAHQQRIDVGLLGELRTLEERVRELERRAEATRAGSDSIAGDE